MRHLTVRFAVLLLLSSVSFLLVLATWLTATPNSDVLAAEATLSHKSAKIDFASSAKLYDVLLTDDGSIHTPDDNSDDEWLPENPGNGKVIFKTAVYIPKDYFEQVGVNPSDEEVFTTLSAQTVGSITDYNQFATLGINYYDPQIVVHSEYTLEEMLCYERPITCDNWQYLIHRANVDAKESDNDPWAFYALYIFGGAGVAGTGSTEFFIGDWGFSHLFGYSVPGCTPVTCSLDRFFYTVRHEMGHALGIPWHPGQYPNYPSISIMDGGEWNNFYLLDHPGYPEQYQVCQSSLNTGLKNCAERFTPPSRPASQTFQLEGSLLNTHCQSFDTTQQIFFTRSPYGLGWGNRLLVAKGNITENGTFQVSFPTDATYSWQRGYGLKVAAAYPDQDPDVNEFFDGSQFHYNPTLDMWCDDWVGNSCYHSNQIILPVSDEACATLYPSHPTKPFVTPFPR